MANISDKLHKELGREYRNGNYEVTDSGIFMPRQKLMIGGVFGHNVIRDGSDLGWQHDSNIVVNEGLNHILDVVYHNATQVPTWYIGIFKGNYTPVATDTAANIATNSTEATEYTEATREEYIEAAASAQSITNSATVAEFTINATVTIYGAFLVSTSTKGGTTGVLSSASRFAAARSLVASDILQVTYTLSAADA